MSRRTLAVTGALTVAAVIGGGVWWRARPSTPTAPTPPERPAIRADVCELRPGDTLAYSVEMRTAMSVDTQVLTQQSGTRGVRVNAAQPPAALGLRVTATLQAIAIGDSAPSEGAAPDRQIVAAVLADPSVESAGQPRDLRPPFLLAIGRDCALRGFARSKSTPRAVARLQQAMMYELDARVPEASEERVVGTGEDSAGAFHAEFAITKGGQVERSTLRYDQLWGNGTPQANERRPSLASQHLAATIDDGHWFASVASERRLAFPDGAATSSTTTSSKRAAFVASALEGVSRDPADYVWEDLLPQIESRPMDAKAPPDAKVAALSPTEAIAQYQALFSTKAHMATAIGFLRSYLLAHPEFADRILREVTDGRLKGVQAASVFAALQQTPTPQAKAALSRTKEDTSASPLDRGRSTLALADRDDIGADFVRTLARDARNARGRNAGADAFVGHEALLALGVVAKRASSRDPETAKAAKEALVSAMKDADKDVTMLAPAFGGIGNTGDETLLPEVSPYTRSDDPQVREAAAQVLRNMPVDKTAGFTSEWLSHEDSPSARRQIYATAQQQAHDQRVAPDARVLDLAIADLARSPGPDLRYALIRVLGEAVAAYPPARAALARQFQVEPEAHLRKLIGSYLRAEELAQP